jgi:hypothetical protein
VVGEIRRAIAEGETHGYRLDELIRIIEKVE